ncbi:MAG TPA: transcriptional regulator, partial [Ruminococcaceae bacterium]|nr:transcriptional regulator [Oscillospiraceae bacterium]
MNTKEIGAKIAALRKKQGITQEALAEQVGVSAQAVSKWE